MFVAGLRLVNFRSYADTAVEFGPRLNVIVGRNASGKTNLLEGAWFALRATSCRTNREEKAVRWGAQFARAEATVIVEEPGDAAGSGRGRSISVAYAPGQGKQVRINGVETQSLDDLRRQGNVFVFVPESLLLVKGSPARRRAHLDAFASGLDSVYEAAVRDLQTVLRQRNVQLARVRDGAPGDTLDPWDRQLAAISVALFARRRALVERLAAQFSRYADQLAPAGERFEISLVSHLSGLEPGDDAFVEALRERRTGDVGRATSCFGPHRDDVRFAEVGGDGMKRAGTGGDEPVHRDLRMFGSQGEQRAAVLALLLAERALAAEMTGDVGTLLLDDVMSELDDARRRLLVQTLMGGGQTIITTTNRLYFTEDELRDAVVIELAPEGPPPADGADDSADHRG